MTSNGYKFGELRESEENVLKLIVVMVAQCCGYILKTTELHSLNGLTEWYVKYTSIKLL